jgi:hypothetical protein
MLRPAGSNRYSIADIFRDHWWDFFRQYRPWVRPVVFKNVRKILACRTEALGFHVYRCPQGCGHTVFVPHSCKSRLCPTCGKHATDAWADQVLNDLLDVPYHHLILSVPALLALVFHFNRRVFLNLIFRAARESILDWGEKTLGVRLGLVMVLQTFGSALNLHIHVHLLVTGGGLRLDDRRWIATDPRWLMHHAGLKVRWKYHVLAELRQAHKEERLRFAGPYGDPRIYSKFNAMLAKLWPLTWYAWIGASLLDPRFTVRYIGRYTKRAALAEYRIVHYDGRKVGFLFKDYADGGRIKVTWLSVFAFIARLIRHIPDEHFPMVRYAGLFANRCRRQCLKQARAALGQPGPRGSASPQPPRTWAQRQADYHGVDPLWCPRCECPLEFAGCLFGIHAEIRGVLDRYSRSGHLPEVLKVARAPG